MATDRQELWRSTHLLTADKKELARAVLDQNSTRARCNQDLAQLSDQGGGYLNKSMLVSIYNEMV